MNSTFKFNSIIIESIGLFLIGLAFVAFLQLYYPGLIGVDGYYHLRLSQLIPSSGFWVDVSWLPFTVLGDEGTDHHWLWHLLLVPFAFLSDDVALDVAVIFTTAIVPVILNVFYRKLGVPYAPLFAILSIAASTLMPGRLMMLRAQNLSLIYVIAFFYTLVKRKNVFQFIIAFLFMQSYHGAIILVPLTGMYFALRAILHREIDWRVGLPVASGLLLGLLINPWFPVNIDYFLFHTLFKTAALTPGLVGQEWQSVPAILVLIQSLPAHLFLLAGLLFWVLMCRKSENANLAKIKIDTALSLVLTLLFLALYFFAWRFAEYYVPFALLSTGLLVRDSWPEVERLRTSIVSIIAAFSLCFGMWFGWLGVANTVKTHAEDYSEISEYLENNADQGEILFNSDWSDFVRVFWHTQRIGMVNGLDGHFLAYGDPIRFQQWYTLISLEFDVPTTLSPQQVSEIVRQSFNSRFALINKQHQALAEFLTGSQMWEVVVEEESAWLLKYIEPS